MKAHTFVAVAIALCHFAPSHAQVATPQMFGALPTVSEAAISPDGSSMAFIQNGAGGPVIGIYDISGGGSKPLGVSLGDAKARNIVWGDNQNILVLISRAYDLDTATGLKKTEMWRWLTIDKAKGKPILIFDNDPGFYNPDSGDLLATPIGTGNAVFSRWTHSATKDSGNVRGGPTRLEKDSGWRYSLFSVELANGKERRLSEGEEATEEWVVDASGSPLVRVDYDPSLNRRKIYGRKPGGSSLSLVAEMPEPGGSGRTVSFHGLAPGVGKALATRVESGRTAISEFDYSNGAFGAPGFSAPAGEIDGFSLDLRTARATAILYADDMPRAWQIDPADRKTQQSLQAAIPNASSVIVSTSDDKSRMIVRSSFTNHPDQFFLFDRTAKRLDMVGATHAALDGKVFATKEKFDFVASDGLAIPGYLTVPKGASKSKMPLIVLPHGGPASRDYMTFDWWPFFYAARGYLVYQPNFRGSDGYGLAFKEAGYGQWGLKMQSDVSEGVKKLISTGIADPDRICIVGASYGGYAALAGATLTPELYSCAVSVNGVSDLPIFVGTISKDNEYADDYLSLRIGDRFRDVASLAAVSPARLANQAGPPILLIHGKDDTVVPMSQSKIMKDALDKAGKASELVLLEGEDHWLSVAQTRIKMLEASIAFIDKHIGVNAR